MLDQSLRLPAVAYGAIRSRLQCHPSQSVSAKQVHDKPDICESAATGTDAELGENY